MQVDFLNKYLEFETMSVMKYVAELNGYLKSLQLLNGPNYKFGVHGFEFDGDIESFLKSLNFRVSYSKFEMIDFEEAKLKFFHFTLNGLISPCRFSSEDFFKYYSEMMFEDVNEYYGLVAVSQNKRGVFHPLIKGPIYQLHVDNGDYQTDYFSFLVRIENFFILTHLKKPLKARNAAQGDADGKAAVSS